MTDNAAEQPIQEMNQSSDNDSENLTIDSIYDSFQPQPDQNSTQKPSDSDSTPSVNNASEGNKVDNSALLGMFKNFEQLSNDVNAMKQSQDEAQLKATMDSVIDNVNQHVNLENRDLLKAMIDMKVEQNPKLEAVFQNMSQSPENFDKAMEVLGKDILKDINNIPNQRVTEHSNALNTSHNNFSESGGTQNENPFQGKSNEEVYAHMRKLSQGY